MTSARGVCPETKINRQDSGDGSVGVSDAYCNHEDLGLDSQNPHKLDVATGTYNPIPEGQGAETGKFPRLNGHSVYIENRSFQARRETLSRKPEPPGPVRDSVSRTKRGATETHTAHSPVASTHRHTHTLAYIHTATQECKQHKHKKRGAQGQNTCLACLGSQA